MANADGHRPGEGHVRCRFTAKTGSRCGNWEVDGLEYCVQHVDDELLEEAEDIVGIRRCRHNFGQPDACRQYAVASTVPPQCKNHGANQGSASWASAQARTVEASLAERLQAFLADHGERLMHPSPIGDPLTELLHLAAEMGEFRQIMREQVAELIRQNRLGYSNAKVGEQLRYQGVLYERALERFAKVLIDVSKLRIDERLAGVQQQTADMLERALSSALEESGVGLDGIGSARKAFRRQLKVVQGELAS